MGWPTVTLGDVFEVARGGSPRPIDKYITDEEGGVNWISIRDASNSSKYITRTEKKIEPSGVSKSRMVYPGDFLLTNSMSFGRPYILKTSGCIHDGWLVLSGDKEVVDQDYFYHLLGSDIIYRKFASLAAGAVVKNLNTDLVKKISIPLPPLFEQQRIAAILDKADALRAKRREAIAKLDQLLQSVFLEMFGDPVTNPKGWLDTLCLGDTADICSGITKGRRTVNEVREVPYLAVANVQDRYLKLGAVKTIKATEVEIDRYRLAYNDLLLTEGGDPDKLGRGALWDGSIADCIHQNHVFRVRVTSSSVNSVYLNWLVGSARGKQYFLRMSKQTTGIASINITQLKSFPLLMPPIELQEQFAETVSRIEMHRQGLKQSEDGFDKLFHSLQQQAFAGTL